MSSHRLGAIFGPGAGYGHDPRHTGGPSATSAIEWRVDTSDGCAYTKVEFERFYGFYSGTCKWKAALQATPAPRQYRATPAADATTTSAIERRMDSSDGCAYTKLEFKRFSWRIFTSSSIGGPVLPNALITLRETSIFIRTQTKNGFFLCRVL
jgi:hypothetical protein